MDRNETTTVAVSGGGPAGIMLGLLLARAGVEVTVLEKHGDFLRDFRGDTVHPSTLETLDELGLGGQIDRIPHRKLHRLTIGSPEQPFVNGDLAKLPGRYKHIAMIPQWDFLTMLTEHAARYPGFRLRMNAKSTGLLDEGGATRGLVYEDAEGSHELRAVLTVSAEGRDSALRDAAGLTPVNLGAPIDVLWLQVSRRPDDPDGLNGRLGSGAMVVAVDRGDYWQLAYLIPKGGIEQVKADGIKVFQDRLVELLPFLDGRVTEEVHSFDRVAFLNVELNRLPTWHRAGFLAIGDAAHAMSPVGGVGINLAVQDAVATANLLAERLHDAQGHPDRFTRTLNPDLLAQVRRQRWTPTVGTQAIQRLIQTQVLERALLRGGGMAALPAPLRAVAGSRAWSSFIARSMVYGIRPEHVRSPERPVPRG
ncbi:2-polyprenyl-6-methoxyphenol hydroxylase-like FAD-dependent oxidoreductase [Murinocardiopsis flavida]|uniref:2-polyprenyl-6-methoxyphenol hydroxylase-like FAD-dependent oxidoreductase n=1 Tax=Murinocardiopsis flavida TaxID=645275 RepID=A0A2P8D6V1_9ACTN|nr:FAD-dependent oxidoreductase [Murinocardiopsis flavida]PSK92956.1 2-polyprenyl-6-methoxyphenol hydroxylase-like FAD-dependent oxidoreductase [Murinocardiopsis flavida]